MELQKAIKERHSVRKFLSKKPDWKKLIECIDAARLAPMAGNNYSVKFIVVDDKEKICKIADACQQSFVAQAPYVIVVCSDTGRTKNAYEERSAMFIRQQAGAAIENFLLKITDQGLASCWVGYFSEEQIKRILFIPDSVQVEAVLPVGYEFEKQRTRKDKIDLDAILKFNSYKNKKMNPPRKMDI